VEGHEKTKAKLADKYLQPLCTPKIYGSGEEGREQMKAIASKLYRGEKTTV